MEQAISTGQELIKHFQDIIRVNNKGFKQRSLKVYVRSKVRRDVLCSVEQGTLVADGWVYKITFESLGDGVYKAGVGGLK